MANILASYVENPPAEFSGNNRCPLRDECGIGESKCRWIGKEISCPYYYLNASVKENLPEQEKERTLVNTVIEDESEDYPLSPLQFVPLPIDSLHPVMDDGWEDLGNIDIFAERIKAKGFSPYATTVDEAIKAAASYSETGSPTYMRAPVTVEFRDEGGYTIKTGYRICEAAKIAALKTILCEITPKGNKEMDEKMRKTMSPFASLTMAYLRLFPDYFDASNTYEMFEILGFRETEEDILNAEKMMTPEMKDFLREFIAEDQSRNISEVLTGFGLFHSGKKLKE